MEIEMEQFLNSTIINAQEIFTKKEKAAWAKFEAVRDAEYKGAGSRAIKKSAIDAARLALKIELTAAEDEYAAAVGA